jgi:hypothetical protein
MREPTDAARAADATLPGGPRRWSRRRLLAAAGGALLAGGAAIALVRTSGYAVPSGQRLAVFAPWQFVVVQHAARRITAPDRPRDPTIPSADEAEVASFADTWMTHLPEKPRQDLARFLAYVEHLAPIRAGFGSRFTRLPPADQDRVLAAIETSSSDLLRAGFDGLRSLVFLGYYRDPRTWKVIGYDGPLVGRPARGW